MMLFQKYRSLIINGKHYNASELKAFCDEKLNELPSENREYNLYQFITEWLDASPTVEARTSGTTGTPKKIQISKDKMIQSAQMTMRHLQLLPKDTALLSLSCEHIAGKMMIVRAFSGNLNLITVEPSSNPLKPIPVNHKIDFTAFVPMQVNEILKDEKTSRQFGQIKNVLIGGAQVSHEMEERLKQFSNNIYETYGMTETISHVALKKYSHDNRQPITDNHLYFTTLENITVKTDNRNCLVITAPLFSEEPIITNDIVELKDEKRFKWLGRFDNVVNSGGVKLIPELLEEKVRKLIHRRYFFMGIPDKKLSQKLVLVIEGKPFSKIELNQLKARLSKSLGKYEIPREIVFIPKLKVTANGKILRVVDTP